MSAGEGDKRKVSTDALETLGTVIGPGEKRDAIHLAVIPVVAKQRVFPGEHVGSDGTPSRDPVGIVDPFLSRPVEPGQGYWLVIYPRMIHSLRHVWTHPAFADEPETQQEAEPQVEMLKKVDPTVEASMQWIRDYAKRLGTDFETLMHGAEDWVASQKSGDWGEYLNLGGLLEGVSTNPRFWDHYSVVKQEPVAEEHRESFFTCSC